MENNIDNISINTLSKYYTINNNVIKHLENNQLLSKYLIEIIPILKKDFPKREYRLDYTIDPEIEELNHITLKIKNNQEKEYDGREIKKLLNFDKKTFTLQEKYNIGYKIVTQVI